MPISREDLEKLNKEQLIYLYQTFKTTPWYCSLEDGMPSIGLIVGSAFVGFIPVMIANFF